MQYVKRSISFTEKDLLILDKVAELKGRSRSQQVRESLHLDPDFYEIEEGLKNEQ